MRYIVEILNSDYSSYDTFALDINMLIVVLKSSL